MDERFKIPSKAKVKTQSDIEAVLTNAKGAAAMLDISVAMFYRLLSAGRIGPQPIRLGSKCIRFSVVELHNWALANCPSREKWIKIKNERTL